MKDIRRKKKKEKKKRRNENFKFDKCLIFLTLHK